MKKGLARIAGFRKKENRLFVTILSYFLSLLIPIVIIGVSEYWYSVRVIKNEFNERIAANLSTAAAGLDAYIQTAQETGVNFLYDETVRWLLMPKAKQSLEIRSELGRLPRILQRNENIVSHFIDSMFAYIDTEDVYVSGGVNGFASFFNNMYRYEQYDDAFWANKRYSDKSIELLPASQVRIDNRTVKRVVPIVMTNLIPGGNAVMVANIPIDAIEQTLKGNAVFASTQFAVMDGGGNVLYDKTGTLSDPAAAARLQASFETNGTLELTFGGKRYMTGHFKSDLYGWEYYSFTPSGEFNRQTINILSMTLLLCVVLMIMGIAFSLIFSIRIYNPIRSLRDIIIQKNEAAPIDAGPEEGAAAGGTNEFELIRRGIDRLSSSRLAYKVKYDKHTSEYVEYALLFLLKGHTLNREEILRETLRAEFGFTRGGLLCCTVVFDFKEAFYRDVQDTDRLSIISGIKKIIWSLLAAEVPAYVAEPKQNLFACVVNIDGEDETERLYKAFGRMLDIFEYDIRMYYDITIGIGTLYTDVNEIGVSFNEAMTAVGKRNKEQRFQIVDSNKLAIKNSYQYSFYDEQKIVNYLKMGDVDGVCGVVADIAESNERRGISYEHLQQLFKEMHATGIRFLAERGQAAAELEDEASRLQPEEPGFEEAYVGSAALQERLGRFYALAIERTKAQRGPKTGNLVSLIEKYIQDHYTQDLGLEQIADEMGVSVKYVSRVFKDKTGVLLTDYINQVRIEKAKELLLSTELRVNDIGERIGIPSRTTFLRVFKKVEGLSPNEFRLKHKGAE